MESNYKTDLSLYNNKWYQPGNGAKRLLWHTINMLFIKTSFPWPNAIKIYLLRLFGSKIGSSVIVKPGVNIKYPWFLEIGKNVWIGEAVWIDNLAKVTIGNNVCISQGAMLLTGNHNYRKKSFDLMISGIELEEGVWVGAKSVVCPGVKMHSHSILSVGSIITAEAMPYFIYQGNPAMPVKTRTLISDSSGNNIYQMK